MTPRGGARKPSAPVVDPKTTAAMATAEKAAALAADGVRPKGGGVSIGIGVFLDYSAKTAAVAIASPEPTEPKNITPKSDKE